MAWAPSRLAFWITFTRKFWSHYVSQGGVKLRSPFRREPAGRSLQLPRWSGWGHALPMLLSVSDSIQQGIGAGPCLPNMEPLTWAKCIRAAHGLAETSSELHCNLRLFLPNPPSFCLSFPRCHDLQISQLFHVSSPLFISQARLAFLIWSWIYFLDYLTWCSRHYMCTILAFMLSSKHSEILSPAAPLQTQFLCEMYFSLLFA